MLNYLDLHVNSPPHNIFLRFLFGSGCLWLSGISGSIAYICLMERSLLTQLRYSSLFFFLFLKWLMITVFFPHFWLPLCIVSHPLPIIGICNYSNCIVISFLRFSLNVIVSYTLIESLTPYN